VKVTLEDTSLVSGNPILMYQWLVACLLFPSYFKLCHVLSLVRCRLYLLLFLMGKEACFYYRCGLQKFPYSTYVSQWISGVHIMHFQGRSKFSRTYPSVTWGSFCICTVHGSHSYRLALFTRVLAHTLFVCLFYGSC
jgi:hypothetical protein